MSNYNSIESQYPAEYGGLWDDDLEARIEAALAAADEDEDYDDLTDEFVEAFSSEETEQEIQDLHLHVERLYLDLAFADTERDSQARSLKEIRTELDASYLRMETLLQETIVLREENGDRGKYIMELHSRIRNLEAHNDELNDHIVELTMTL